MSGRFDRPARADSVAFPAPNNPTPIRPLPKPRPPLTKAERERGLDRVRELRQKHFGRST